MLVLLPVIKEMRQGLGQIEGCQRPLAQKQKMLEAGRRESVLSILTSAVIVVSIIILTAGGRGPGGGRGAPSEKKQSITHHLDDEMRAISKP